MMTVTSQAVNNSYEKERR